MYNWIANIINILSLQFHANKEFSQNIDFIARDEFIATIIGRDLYCLLFCDESPTMRALQH